MEYTLNLPEVHLTLSFPKNIEEITTDVYKTVLTKYIGQMATREVRAKMTEELEFLISNNIIINCTAEIKFPSDI